MLSPEVLEALSFVDDFDARSSFIPDRSWHRENRIAVLKKILPAKEPLWVFHCILMELSNNIGFLPITYTCISEITDITQDVIKKTLPKLRTLNLWMYWYDQKKKVIFFQVNPSLCQKFNDAKQERKAVASWETLSYKAFGKTVPCEFTLEQAEDYAKFRSALGKHRASDEASMFGTEVLVQYLEKRDEKLDNVQAEMQELKNILLGMVKGEPEAEVKAKDYLKLVPSIES